MVYNYTKPRAPIGALYVSPGPAYALPSLVGDKGHDPRSVHYKYPSYSFGVRHGKFKDSSGPGPGYYPNPKVYRDGQDGVPHYSLYSRPRAITCFRTPAPGAYSPELSTNIVHYQYPAYSFGARHQQCRNKQVPAPNLYTLPDMIGPTVQSGKPQAPCYSFRRRPEVEKYVKTPGPGIYSTTDPNVFKNKAPLYSLTGRNRMPGDTTTKPGPGAHVISTACVKKCSPAYSFGIRHTEFMFPLIVDITYFVALQHTSMLVVPFSTSVDSVSTSRNPFSTSVDPATTSRNPFSTSVDSVHHGTLSAPQSTQLVHHGTLSAPQSTQLLHHGTLSAPQSTQLVHHNPNQYFWDFRCH